MPHAAVEIKLVAHKTSLIIDIKNARIKVTPAQMDMQEFNANFIIELHIWQGRFGEFSKFFILILESLRLPNFLPTIE